MTKEEEILYVGNGDIEEIATDVDEILEDTEKIEEIGEDTDEILKRVDKNTKMSLELNMNVLKSIQLLQATKTALWILILVWIIQFLVDKVVMWIMLGYR